MGLGLVLCRVLLCCMIGRRRNFVGGFHSILIKERFCDHLTIVLLSGCLGEAMFMKVSGTLGGVSSLVPSGTFVVLLQERRRTQDTPSSRSSLCGRISLPSLSQRGHCLCIAH